MKLSRPKSTQKREILQPKHLGVQKFLNVRKLVRKAKTAGLTVVTTNGCFDIVHVGHVRFLAEAKRLGDLLVVGINSDNSVKTLKGSSRPIVPERERAEMVASFKPVDAVFVFNEKTPNTWLKVLLPHIHVKGGNYSFEQIAERAVVEAGGGKLVLVSHTKNRSTTNVIDKIEKLQKK